MALRASYQGPVGVDAVATGPDYPEESAMIPVRSLAANRLLVVLALAVITVVTHAPAQAQTVRLHAAGSLRAALDEVAREFERREQVRIEAVYGASGLLRERIARGEAAEVFASANMAHPASLAAAGRAMPPIPFTRNMLCALTRPEVGVQTGNLLERMLDPGVRLGTSTPKADPSGDYAFELFGKAEALRPGARRTLEDKALKLTGGPDSPPPPPGRSAYGDLVARRQADIFLTYCTNALLARRDFPDLVSVPTPPELSVGALYGLTVLRGAPEPAWRFAWFILSDDGQAILTRHGFGALR